MILYHHRADHVHVTDAADDGQTDHDQQPGHSAPFHAKSDRWHGVAVHQWPVVHKRGAHHRHDDSRGRLVDHVRGVEILQHGVRRLRNRKSVTYNYRQFQRRYISVENRSYVKLYRCLETKCAVSALFHRACSEWNYRIISLWVGSVCTPFNSVTWLLFCSHAITYFIRYRCVWVNHMRRLKNIIHV